MDLKPGFTVLMVHERDGAVYLKQNRILLSSAVPEDTTRYLLLHLEVHSFYVRFVSPIRIIPLQILSVDGAGSVSIDREAGLRQKEEFIALATSKQFKFNAGATGYYRVLYSMDRLKAIGEAASKEESNVFSVQDRVGLINDAVALARADLRKMSDALDLVYTLRLEKEYHVWAAIAYNLASLKSIWWERATHCRAVEHICRPIVGMLGYQPHAAESADYFLLRTCAITQALDAGDKDVANELKGRFTNFLATSDAAEISSEIPAAVYTAAIRHGGRQEYEAMKAIYSRPKNPAHQISAM
ncbi:ERAP1-like C-terminal domain-containing protein [Mycena crocata]|nr:ERAP1-like C-terminal domain-containing protein [Mycena crocata]